MTCQELGTIMQSGVDVKIMILNNRFLGMVRQWQQLFHDSLQDLHEHPLGASQSSFPKTFTVAVPAEAPRIPIANLVPVH